MKYILASVVVATALMTTGCMTTAKTLAYANNTYKGKTVENLVMDIGVPSGSYTLKSGNILYNWKYSGTITMPGTTVYNGTTNYYGGNTAYTSGTATTYGGGSSSRVCDMNVLATPRGEIISIKFREDTMGTKPATASMCAQMFGK